MFLIAVIITRAVIGWSIPRSTLIDWRNYCAAAVEINFSINIDSYRVIHVYLFKHNCSLYHKYVSFTIYIRSSSGDMLFCMKLKNLLNGNILINIAFIETYAILNNKLHRFHTFIAIISVIFVWKSNKIYLQFYKFINLKEVTILFSSYFSVITHFLSS